MHSSRFCGGNLLYSNVLWGCCFATAPWSGPTKVALHYMPFWLMDCRLLKGVGAEGCFWAVVTWRGGKWGRQTLGNICLPWHFLMLYFISYIPALWRPKIFDMFLNFDCHNQDGMCDMSDGADVLNKAVLLHVFQSLRTLRTLHQAVFCSWFIISLISDCS